MPNSSSTLASSTDLLAGSGTDLGAIVVPSLQYLVPTGTGAGSALELHFNTAMTAGSGIIWITDGSVETVIDRASGLPTMRIVGATDTQAVAVSSASIKDGVVTLATPTLLPGLTYHVFMDKGVLASTSQVAFPGQRQSASSNEFVSASPQDSSAPTVASFTLDGTLLASTSPIGFTLKFSEKVTGLSAAAFDAPHGSVSGLSSLDGGLTWTGTLTATDPITSSANQLSVKLGGVTDLAHNAASGTATASQTYAVNPASSSGDIRIGIDTGISAADKVLRSESTGLDGYFFANAKPAGAYVVLSIGDETPVRIANTSYDLATHSVGWSYDRDTQALREGLYALKAQLFDGSGQLLATVTRDIQVDNHAPNLRAWSGSSTDGYLNAGQDIVFQFDEAVYFTDGESTQDGVLLHNDAGEDSYIDLTDANFSADHKTLTLTAAQLKLATGNHYRILLPEALTDRAGNSAGSVSVAFTTNGATVDVVPPRATRLETGDGGAHGVGSTVSLGFHFSEAVQFVGTAPALKLNNGAFAAYDATRSTSTDLVFTYTVKAGDVNTSFLDLYDRTALAGKVADKAGNLLDAAHIAFTGITDATTGVGTTIVIDTVAPVAPGTPLLDASSSAGTGKTNSTTPKLTGIAPEAGGTIEIYVDGTTLAGKAVVGADRSWSLVSYATALTEGLHTLTARQVDAAGNSGAFSGALALTVERLVPGTPGTPVLAAASDSGSSSSDRVTSVTTPLLTGSAAEAGGTVQVYDGGTLLGSASVGSDKTWSFTVPASKALADGTHSLSVKQVNDSGTAGAASSALAVTIDSGAPAAAPAPALAAASDSGSANNDRITNVATPALSGTASETGGTVQVYDGGTLLGSAAAGSDKSWSFTVSAANALADGTHLLSTRQVDAAGNLGLASAALTVVVDKTAPAASAAPLLAAASDSGSSSSDRITNATAPVLYGSAAEAGGTVDVYDGTSLLGSATVGSDKSWTFTTPAGKPLSAGTHSLTIRQTDAAGNTGTASAALQIVVDTAAPGAPGTPVLDAASDSGNSHNDRLTNIATPTITGSGAEAGATVQVYDGTTLLGSATAAQDGSWSFTTPEGKALANGTHSLSAKVVDTAGNTGPASAALAIVIDGATPAAPSTPQLAAISDSGSSSTDLITKVTTPTLGGTAAKASGSVYVYDGGTLLGSATVGADKSWTYTVGTGQALSNGAHGFSAKQVDDAGNASVLSGSLTVTVDTSVAAPAAPTLAAGSDGGTADNITNITTPTLTGSAAEGGGTVQILDGTTVLGTATVGSDKTWSFTVPADKTLAVGAHGFTAVHTDTAGNVSTASSALGVTIDLTAPAAPGAALLSANSDSGKSNADQLTYVTTPALSGSTAEAGGTVNVYDGTSLLGSATVGSDKSWSFTVPSGKALADGTHSLSVKQVDAAGNTSAASTALSVTIDTTVAAPGAPTLDGSSDLASDGARLVSLATPILKGSAAEAGGTLSVYDGNTLLGTVTVGTDKTWTLAIGGAQALSGGSHSVTVKQTDSAGNTSAASSALALIVNVPSAPVLAAGSDTGLSSSDNLTSIATPTLQGTAPQAGGTVKIYDSGKLLGSAAVGNDKTWTYTLTSAQTLSDGIHSLSVAQTNSAGHVSATSNPLLVTIDTVGPISPATSYQIYGPWFASESESGYLSNSAYTADPTPTIFGYVPDSTGTIQIYDKGTLLGTTSFLYAGLWMYDAPTLADGDHGLSFKVVDAAGNVSAASNTLTLHIDTAAPSPPGPPSLDAASDIGSANGYHLTNTRTPTFTGTAAEAGGYIRVYDGTTLLGEATVGTDKSWRFEVSSDTPLAAGTHSFSFRQADLAGNTSGASTYALLVDIPGSLWLAAGSDVGSSDSDQITNIATPTFAGTTALAGGTVKLYADGILLGSATVGADKYWSYTVGASQPLYQGDHAMTVVHTDASGHVSGTSDTLYVRIDTSAPSVLRAPELESTYVYGSDYVLVSAATKPTLSGYLSSETDESGATVSVYEGSKLLGTTTVDWGNYWSFTVPAAKALSGDGQHSLTFKATDAAGNTSALSPALSFTLDTTGPALAGSPSFAWVLDHTTATLHFNEEIEFVSGTRITISDSRGTTLTYLGGNEQSNWHYDGALFAPSDLTFNIGSLTGELLVTFGSGSVTDMLGNVTLVGTTTLHNTTS